MHISIYSTVYHEIHVDYAVPGVTGLIKRICIRKDSTQRETVYQYVETVHVPGKTVCQEKQHIIRDSTPEEPVHQKRQYTRRDSTPEETVYQKRQYTRRDSTPEETIKYKRHFITLETCREPVAPLGNSQDGLLSHWTITSQEGYANKYICRKDMHTRSYAGRIGTQVHVQEG